MKCGRSIQEAYEAVSPGRGALAALMARIVRARRQERLAEDQKGQ
jgi:hypothetical protein